MRIAAEAYNNGRALMTPERWRQIEDLYNSARDNGSGVLANADPDIRREVEALLAQNSSGNIFDRAALDLTASATRTLVMAGSQLGPYKIEALLGQGGMGQVFRRHGHALGPRSCHKNFRREIQ